MFKPFKSLKALKAQKVVPIQTFRAQEIVEDLEAALKQFRQISVVLGQQGSGIYKNN